jgi:hypothetical protein
VYFRNGLEYCRLSPTAEAKAGGVGTQAQGRGRENMNIQKYDSPPSLLHIIFIFFIKFKMKNTKV